MVFLQLKVDIYFGIEEQYATSKRTSPAELAFQVSLIMEWYQVDTNRKILPTILSIAREHPAVYQWQELIQKPLEKASGHEVSNKILSSIQRQRKNSIALL